MEGSQARTRKTSRRRRLMPSSTSRMTMRSRMALRKPRTRRSPTATMASVGKTSSRKLLRLDGEPSRRRTVDGRRLRLGHPRVPHRRVCLIKSVHLAAREGIGVVTQNVKTSGMARTSRIMHKKTAAQSLCQLHLDGGRLPCCGTVPEVFSSAPRTPEVLWRVWASVGV